MERSGKKLKGAKGEAVFAHVLESQGKKLIYEPYIKNFHMKPDFYCIDNDTYYEVVTSRQGYYNAQKKVQEAKKSGIKVEIVHPDGSLFTLKKKGRPPQQKSRLNTRYQLIVNEEEDGLKWNELKSQCALNNIEIRELIVSLLKNWLTQEKAEREWVTVAKLNEQG